MSQQSPFALRLAVAAALVVCSGCSAAEAPYGDTVTVSGSFNGWAKGPRAPKLRWDGSRYQGQVFLPGDQVELRLPFSSAASQASGVGLAAPVPSTVFAAESATQSIIIETPLNAMYELTFDPQRRQLHVDFSADADVDASVLPPGGVKLIQALRGTDQVSAAEQEQRAADLKRYLEASGENGAPLAGGKPETQGFTFLHFNKADQPPVTLVGDFNDWGKRRVDRLLPVLGGHMSYKGLQSDVTELLYRFESGDERYVDPLNPEVDIDGGYVPPNLGNVIGGNQGSFNSIARGAGFFDNGSRLNRVQLTTPRGSLSEVYVYLPQGYNAKGTVRYPVLYIHDGRDALVRGHYNAALDLAISGSRIPPVIAVFVPAQSDAEARLADFTAFPDDRFPAIKPKADEYLSYFTSQIVPTVEQRYPINKDPGQAALLGVDMAGPLSFYLAWKDQTRRYTRVASQSGRFGWGYLDASPDQQPFVELITKTNRGDTLQQISIEYLRGDGYQVTAANKALHDFFSTSAAYKGRVNLPDASQVVTATSSPWDLWGARLQDTLAFLLMGVTAK